MVDGRQLKAGGGPKSGRWCGSRFSPGSGATMPRFVPRCHATPRSRSSLPTPAGPSCSAFRRFTPRTRWSLASAGTGRCAGASRGFSSTSRTSVTCPEPADAEPACFDAGVGGCWSARMPERRSHRFARGRHAGVIVPLFSIPSRLELGDRRDRGPAAARGWLDVRRAGLRAAPAGQRDAGRPELAVFGAERDGDRSDLHRRRGARGLRGAGGVAALSRRRARARRPTCATCAACRVRGGPRREGRRAARARSIGSPPRVRGRLRRARRLRRVRRARRRGGSTTTRSSAPCTTSMAGAYWREWEAGAARPRIRPRLRRRARERLERQSATTSTSSGLPTSSGSRRAQRLRRRSASSATFRSW